MEYHAVVTEGLDFESFDPRNERIYVVTFLNDAKAQDE
ncbi:hypothetical protein PAMC26577_25855 [Caballeronia sordidicola]|uniref:Uncharacterized protein n=1 Tax=Caballeronia sordidicola TaxID=196367 RepID=A0A242MHI8_CABSO|nr:hypothetical protein PAMC26577_25855 [Caballeronia sordidicola]